MSGPDEFKYPKIDVGYTLNMSGPDEIAKNMPGQI